MSRRPGCVVICSGTYFDSPKKMAEYHLAVALSSRIPVLFVDPPTSHLTPSQNRDLASVLRRPRLRTVHSRLHHLTPVAPPKPHARLNVRVTECLARRALRRAADRLGFEPLAIVTTWQLVDVFGAFPDARHVYWWLDDPASAAELWGFDRDRLVAGDESLRRRADLVVAVSQAVVDSVNDQGGNAIFLPNGCDATTMGLTDQVPLAAEVGLVAPIAGFVGQLNSRTDLELLEAVADLGLSLLLIGPHDSDLEPTRFRALCARNNVQWVGSQPFARLPEFQGHLSVGLVPYAMTSFNLASFPLKPLEYLAAGRPVVSTPLPGVQWLESPDVYLAADPATFAAAAASVAAQPLDSGAVARRRAFAAGHSWDARAGWLLDQLQSASIS